MLAAQSKTTNWSQGRASSHESPLDWTAMVRPLEPFLKAVGDRLADQIKAFDADLGDYAEYALTSHGKQLRPALVGLSAQASGQLADAHVTVAVIIEMVHLATLVHDDIIDEAAIRRGRPTLAAKWGNEISVLLGDCLFARALELAASFPTPDVCRAVSASTNTVCSGETLQTQQRRKFNLSRDEYFKVVAMKTGELFALSCDLGAYLSGAQPAWRTGLRQYGLALGTAYQVFDDCMDVFGAEEAAGKSLGTDLAKGKITLPVLLALEQGGQADASRLKTLLNDWQPEHLPNLLALLEKHQTLASSRQTIAQFLESARQSLKPLPASSHLEALQALTDALQRQSELLGAIP